MEIPVHVSSLSAWSWVVCGMCLTFYTASPHARLWFRTFVGDFSFVVLVEDRDYYSHHFTYDEAEMWTG